MAWSLTWERWWLFWGRALQLACSSSLTNLVSSKIHKYWEILGVHIDLNREKNFWRWRNGKQNISQKGKAVQLSCLPKLIASICLLIISNYNQMCNFFCSFFRFSWVTREVCPATSSHELSRMCSDIWIMIFLSQLYLFKLTEMS